MWIYYSRKHLCGTAPAPVNNYFVFFAQPNYLNYPEQIPSLSTDLAVNSDYWQSGWWMNFLTTFQLQDEPFSATGNIFPNGWAKVKLPSIKWTLNLYPHAWKKTGCSAAISSIPIAPIRWINISNHVEHVSTHRCSKVLRSWTRLQSTLPFLVPLTLRGILTNFFSLTAESVVFDAWEWDVLQFQQ